MDDWISKKELLQATGISYGQLYRWKRERLIPDSWFVKRSTFTGQETFMPRTRAIERVCFIRDNKDRYSLQQLLDLLSPGAENRTYAPNTLAALGGLPRAMAQPAPRTADGRLGYVHALCALIASDALKAAPDMPDEALGLTLRALADWHERLNLFNLSDGRFVLLKAASGYLPLCALPDSRIAPPEGVLIAYELSLSDIPDRFTKRLNQISEGV